MLIRRKKVTYNRSIDELQEHATLWWPETLQSENATSSIIPRLIETQTQFLSLLNLCTRGPFQIFNLLESAEFPANLFLKHLVVLSDYGGEPMQRLGRSFKDIFPESNGFYYMDFSWQNSTFTYNFEELPIRGLGNKKLAIDGEGLSTEKPLSGLIKDMIAILLFASTSDVSDQAGLSACEIGSLLGNEDALETFVKQRYIVVSRIGLPPVLGPMSLLVNSGPLLFALTA